MPKSVSIYGLADPLTGHLCYVGKTTQTLQARLNRHRVRARAHTERRIRCAVWIADLLASGHEPEIFLIEEVEASAWTEAEQFWIAYFRAVGANLLNMTAGGGATLGHKHAPETIERLKSLSAAQWADPANRQRQAERAREAWRRPEVKLKTAASQRAVMTPERRAEMSEARRRQWAEDSSYRANVVAAQQNVDRSSIAKNFWERPQYRARQAEARARRRARGWNAQPC